VAQILIVGEALGQEEARLGVPFVGPSGGVLLRMLDEASILTLDATDRGLLNQYYRTRNPRYNAKIWERHPDVARTNVFNLHPEGNDLATLCGPKFLALDDYPALIKSKYVSRTYQPELDRLAAELLTLNPNLVICLGNTPLWALSGRTGIKKFRGTTFLSTHVAADFKCIATYHPAYIIRQWKDRSIVIADLIKALRESTTPTITRPEREIWIEPQINDIVSFITTQIRARREPLSVDIETTGSRVTCLGFGYSDIAIVIPFDDSRAKGRSYWPTIDDEVACWNLTRQVLEDGTIPKLFQNGLYDIAFLYRSMGIRVMGATEDTLLAHHALQPEMIKDLGFLGSVYGGNEAAWKHLGKRARTIKGDN
jgi:uracil-DNA glycosylase